MARERFVTRTINEVTCKALVCDTTNGTVHTESYKLTAVTDEKVALKQLKKLYETDELVIVKVTAMEVQEVLYGMPEVDFIKYAKIMQDYFHKPE